MEMDDWQPARRSAQRRSGNLVNLYLGIKLAVSFRSPRLQEFHISMADSRRSGLRAEINSPHGVDTHRFGSLVDDPTWSHDGRSPCLRSRPKIDLAAAHLHDHRGTKTNCSIAIFGPISKCAASGRVPGCSPGTTFSSSAQSSIDQLLNAQIARAGAHAEGARAGCSDPLAFVG